MITTHSLRTMALNQNQEKQNLTRIICVLSISSEKDANVSPVVGSIELGTNKPIECLNCFISLTNRN